MKGLKIAVIGGGSTYTPELIAGFIERIEELPVEEIHLVDIEEGEEKLKIVGEFAKRMVAEAEVNININLTLDREEALKNADFVATQFRVGGLEARARDERIPLKYNVLGQETTGPGGFAKAIRTIPEILNICNEIENLAPNAWLINFTNPSGIITETVSKYSSVNVVGLCNVPIGMKEKIAKIMDVSRDRIKVDFIGLNHLVWGNKVYLDDKEITMEVIKRLGNEEKLNMRNIPDLNWDQDFLRSLKMIPCPYHRYYYMTEELVAEEKEAAKKEGTRAEQVMEIEKELLEIYKNPELKQKPSQLEQRGGAYYSDVAVSLISAIYNDKQEVQPVNVRNNGAISDLPDNVVIETNSVIDNKGGHPLTIGKLPTEISGLIQAVKSYEELTIEAGVEGDYEKALKALVANPLVPSVEKAKKLTNEILEKNKEYLPQF